MSLRARAKQSQTIKIENIKIEIKSQNLRDLRALRGKLIAFNDKSIMNQSEYDQIAEQTMVAIEEAIDNSGAEIDYDTISDILTLEFENGSKIIINKQGPVQQLWVAAKSGGFHFDYDADSKTWRLDSNESVELFAALSQYCSEQAGEAVDLT